MGSQSRLLRVSTDSHYDMALGQSIYVRVPVKLNCRGGHRCTRSVELVDHPVGLPGLTVRTRAINCLTPSDQCARQRTCCEQTISIIWTHLAVCFSAVQTVKVTFRCSSATVIPASGQLCCSLTYEIVAIAVHHTCDVELYLLRAPSARRRYTWPYKLSREESTAEKRSNCCPTRSDFARAGTRVTQHSDAISKVTLEVEV